MENSASTSSDLTPFDFDLCKPRLFSDRPGALDRESSALALAALLHQHIGALVMCNSLEGEIGIFLDSQVLTGLPGLLSRGWSHMLKGPQHYLLTWRLRCESIGLLILLPNDYELEYVKTQCKPAIIFNLI